MLRYNRLIPITGQVVGRKTVWLAPPTCDAGMYPFDAPDPAGAESDLELTLNSKKPSSSTSMANTSRVDVFHPESTFARFHSAVLPHAMSATLGPGDVLFVPPGWWHAMRSEETSFSVSMWF
jgi:hypothetical protein